MMLQLHQGLALSVPLYALPLLGLSASQTENLEATQRIDLRVCLGVFRSAHSDMSSASPPASQLLHCWHASRRPESRLGHLLCVLGDVAGPSPALAQLPALHTDPHPLAITLHVDGMSTRRRTADIAARQLAHNHVERAALGAGERLAFWSTSTTAELAAILLALRLVRSRRYLVSKGNLRPPGGASGVCTFHQVAAHPSEDCFLLLPLGAPAPPTPIGVSEHRRTPTTPVFFESESFFRTLVDRRRTPTVALRRAVVTRIGVPPPHARRSRPCSAAETLEWDPYYTTRWPPATALVYHARFETDVDLTEDMILEDKALLKVVQDEQQFRIMDVIIQDDPGTSRAPSKKSTEYKLPPVPLDITQAMRKHTKGHYLACRSRLIQWLYHDLCLYDMYPDKLYEKAAKCLVETFPTLADTTGSGHLQQEFTAATGCTIEDKLVEGLSNCSLRILEAARKKRHLATFFDDLDGRAAGEDAGPENEVLTMAALYVLPSLVKERSLAFLHPDDPAELPPYPTVGYEGDFYQVASFIVSVDELRIEEATLLGAISTMMAMYWASWATPFGEARNYPLRMRSGKPGWVNGSAALRQ
ncbi:hypothetical protein HPB47_014004, partial [Ixodes persulcatus]